MTPDVCIYHANCMDGFTAAWVVKRRFPDVELIPASYGDPLQVNPIAGKHVLIVDFSYDAAVLRYAATEAKSIVVLDHHKTAREELAPFEVGPIDHTVVPEHGAVLAHFDMDKSGARLAWEYCYLRARTVPPIVSYTEDRDLWRWQLPESRAINAALGSFTQDLDQWDRLNEAVRQSIGRGDESIIVFTGKAILNQRDKDIEALIGTTKRQMVIGGHVVDVCNAPFYLASDVGNILGRDKPFAATYFDNPDGRIFSLRSDDAGMDVSVIAKTYGGGGHAHAAGFKMPRGWEGDGLGDIERAARVLEKRIETIVAENGSYEPDTNVTNLPEWAETAVEELESAAAEMRALAGGGR